MLFGPAKETGDIKMADVTPDAFKDFLQFFYRTKVELNAENLLEVMNLGKQYMLDDCLTACTEFCEATLTLENMCWGYELAILFDLTGLKEFCEQKIAANPKEIFRSNSFLNFQSNVLHHILQLDSLECCETMVFDACIAWAKHAHIRNGGSKSKTMEHIRTQLGDNFYNIRFGEFTHKQFHDRFNLYDGLFSLDEFRDITMMITSKEFRTGKFNRCPRLLPNQLQNDANEWMCDRKALNPIWYKIMRDEYLNVCTDKTEFEVNLMQQLTEIRCMVKFQGINATAKIKMSATVDGHDDLLFFANILMKNNDKTVIKFPAPITVKPSVKYQIAFELEDGYQYTSELVRNIVRMDKGLTVKFSGEQCGMQSLVKALQFNRHSE